MSLDVSTYVVFGARVDKSVVQPIKKVRGCSHETDLSKKFCSECGKPVWIEEKNYLLDAMDDRKLSYFYADYNSDEVVVGFVLAKSESHRSANPEILEVKQPTQAMFEEVVEFFKKNDIPLEVFELKTFAFASFSY